ncbi:hypothetical protein BAE44_0010399, partial [Dichanthelium oligosanthes]
MGLEFGSEQEAYEFYRYYGWKVGFNVRKEYANRSKKTGEITSRKFACSREGRRASHTSKALVPDSRSGCNAHLIVRRPKAGAKLEVYAFQPRHNHLLFAPSFTPCPFLGTAATPDAGSLPDGTESENFLEKSSNARAKESKKGQKNKTQPRNCIEKGLRKKQKVLSEPPSVMYSLSDASARSENAMFQGLKAPSNMVLVGSQVPAYNASRGVDLSNPMEPINYEGIHPGLSPNFTPELGFVTYHPSLASSDSPQNQ